MRNYDYGYGFKPISPWGYVGYSLLWAIPVVGWIIWLCTAIGSKQRNVRNFARSVFCGFITLVIAASVVVGTAFILNVCKVIDLKAILAWFGELGKLFTKFPISK